MPSFPNFLSNFLLLCCTNVPNIVNEGNAGLSRFRYLTDRLHFYGYGYTATILGIRDSATKGIFDSTAANGENMLNMLYMNM